MTCRECRLVAAFNRTQFEKESGLPQTQHPDCGCPCQHRPAEEWEKQFRVPRPEHEEEPK